MSNHANRGMGLEKTIKKLFEHYEEKGIWCHKLEVKQSNGNFIEKSPFDFLIYYNNKLYAFDTKNCKREKISFDNFKLHQIKALTDVENNGGDAFFLVYFEQKKALNKIPVSDVRLMMQDNVKSISYSEERKIKLDLLGVL